MFAITGWSLCVLITVCLLTECQSYPGCLHLCHIIQFPEVIILSISYSSMTKTYADNEE